MGVAVANHTKKGELIRKFASSKMRVKLLLAHGSHELLRANEAKTFEVPENQIIVFVATAGSRLLDTVIDQQFYNIFASEDKLRKLLTATKTDTFPRFIRRWEERAYGPGERCPETRLELIDPFCWTQAMGIHPLPLEYPLRSPRQFAIPPDNIRKACGRPVEDPLMFWTSTGKTAEPRTGAENGRNLKLSELTKVTGAGVLFVAACREIKKADLERLEALNRFTLPVFQKKRKRTNAIVDRNENERARPKKKTAPNVLREAEERRKTRERKAKERRERLKRLEVLKKRLKARSRRRRGGKK